MSTRLFSVLISLALSGVLAGCDSSSSGGTISPPPPPPPPPPPAAMSAAGLWVGQAVTPDVADIVTGFEFNDPDGFILGDAPFTADFMGGVAESRGIGPLYTDGAFSWHVNTAGGSIDFATPGDSLTFSTRTVSGGDVATIRVLDDAGAEISSTAVPDLFQQIVVNRNAGESRIGSVEITVTSGEIVIDSFSFGYPSTAATDDVGCLFAPNDEFICIVSDSTTDEFLSAANGTIQVSGDQVTGTGYLYAAPGAVLLDGETVSPLTISGGTVVESTSLDLTIDNYGLAIEFTSVFDATFDRGADLATVEATYTMFDIVGDPSSFDIDATGAISGQSATGCVLTGQVSVIDAAANAYDVNLIADAATCDALAGDYNGIGITQDELAVDDLFIFGVFIDGQAMIAGEAVK